MRIFVCVSNNFLGEKNGDYADGDAISAKSRHGVLEVIIPKKEAVLPKKINVTAEE